MQENISRSVSQLRCLVPLAFSAKAIKPRRRIFSNHKADANWLVHCSRSFMHWFRIFNTGVCAFSLHTDLWLSSGPAGPLLCTFVI